LKHIFSRILQLLHVVIYLGDEFHTRYSKQAYFCQTSHICDITQNIHIKNYPSYLGVVEGDVTGVTVEGVEDLLVVGVEVTTVVLLVTVTGLVTVDADFVVAGSFVEVLCFDVLSLGAVEVVFSLGVEGNSPN